MKKFVFLFALLIILGTESYGQAKGNINYQEIARQNQISFGPGRGQTSFTPTTQAYFINDSTMQIGARILMNRTAEEYVAILSITQAGETAKICNERIESRIRGFMQSLNKIGFREQDIYVDFISQVPTFEFEITKKVFSKSANEVPTGFELKKNVHLYFKDIKTLDQVMVLAAQQEIYDLVKVDYYLSEPEMNSVYDSLRATARRVIEKKLTTFQALNFDAAPEQFVYQTFSEQLSSVYPVERYSSYSAFSTSSVQKDIKVSSKIKKTPTYFYDKVPYNNYDAVVNPRILEPAIQFSYVMEVRYSLKKK